MTSISRHKINPVFYFLVLVSVSLLLSYFYSKDTNLKTALYGFGPHGYVSQKTKPDNFAKDFMGTARVKHYDRSIVMRSFYYAYKWLGIGPKTFVYPFMLTQSLLFVFSLAYLINCLFRDEAFGMIGTLIVTLTPAAGINLSRFNYGFASTLALPLFYGYATAFTMLSIAFSIQKRYIPTFVFLALTVMTHITLGFFACIFAGITFLRFPKEMLKRDFS